MFEATFAIGFAMAEDDYRTVEDISFAWLPQTTFTISLERHIKQEASKEYLKFIKQYWQYCLITQKGRIPEVCGQYSIHIFNLIYKSLGRIQNTCRKWKHAICPILQSFSAGFIMSFPWFLCALILFHPPPLHNSGIPWGHTNPLFWINIPGTQCNQSV